MKSYLFDTTYILPFCGIDVQLPQIIESLEKITSSLKIEFYISSCSLLEAKSKAIRNYVKTKDRTYLDRVNIALLSFQSNPYFKVIDSWFLHEASANADILYISGQRDYMDCWIAATAKVKGAIFVTEDGLLKNKIRELADWKSLRVINWQEFLEEEITK